MFLYEDGELMYLPYTYCEQQVWSSTVKAEKKLFYNEGIKKKKRLFYFDIPLLH